MGVDKFVFQESLGKLLATRPKCDRKAKHDCSKNNSEGNKNGLVSNSQFLKEHGDHEDDDDRADRYT